MRSGIALLNDKSYCGVNCIGSLVSVPFVADSILVFIASIISCVNTKLVISTVAAPAGTPLFVAGVLAGVAGVPALLSGVEVAAGVPVLTVSAVFPPLTVVPVPAVPPVEFPEGTAGWVPCAVVLVLLLAFVVVVVFAFSFSFTVTLADTVELFCAVSVAR